MDYSSRGNKNFIDLRVSIVANRLPHTVLAADLSKGLRVAICSKVSSGRQPYPLGFHGKIKTLGLESLLLSGSIKTAY